MTKKLISLGVVVAVLLTWAVVELTAGPGYQVKVMLASATNLVVGGRVEANGFAAGEIGGLSVDNGQAMVTLNLDSQYVPLHDGAKVTVLWKALLGERYISITDGPRTNARIPDGGMIPGTQTAPVELDAVLDALNAPTRAHLQSLIAGLDQTVQGRANQTNLQQTLQTAGPALNALGGVLRALGTDGPAIQNLVTRLNSMVSTLAQRNQAISTMVQQVNRLTTLTAQQKTNLNAAIQELPDTLAAADSTLAKVPGTVQQTVPLLNALQPAVATLPAVAANLSPVLSSLEPVAAKLQPTLQAASQLLQYTPGLLTTGTSTITQLEDTVGFLQPELEFLRPYTPEAVGWLSTWASAFADYDSNGHYARIFGQKGLTDLVGNPGIVPFGVTDQPYPLPGANAGQPWTDAFGSSPR